MSRGSPRLRVLIVVAGGFIAAAAGLSVLAQPTSNGTSGAGSLQDSGDNAGPPGVPIIQPPPDSISDLTPTNSAKPHKPPATNSVAANSLAAKPAPPAQQIPVRSPAAILQALDKVTAETMQFSAPVGQRVRYKNLVFTVKACETSGGQASPQASAYVVIDSAPLPSPGVTPTPAKEVFHGWMFASSPELNPFQHPVYDAWLIACMAAAPAPHA